TPGESESERASPHAPCSDVHLIDARTSIRQHETESVSCEGGTFLLARRRSPNPSGSSLPDGFVIARPDINHAITAFPHVFSRVRRRGFGIAVASGALGTPHLKGL